MSKNKIEFTVNAEYAGNIHSFVSGHSYLAAERAAQTWRYDQIVSNSREYDPCSIAAALAAREADKFGAHLNSLTETELDGLVLNMLIDNIRRGKDKTFEGIKRILVNVCSGYSAHCN